MMKYPNPSSYNKHIKTRVDKTLGYVHFSDNEHPLASKGGKVYYHRHVASVKMGKWIDRSYHVHHIDENRQNNDPSNLEVIAPRRHGSKHITSGKERRRVRACMKCSRRFITVDNDFCSRSCAASFRLKGGIHTKISKDTLDKLLWEIPTSQIGKMLGCSDVMVAKLCKRWSLSKPPRGYWAKKASGK